jgi:hypothetical protein
VLVYQHFGMSIAGLKTNTFKEKNMKTWAISLLILGGLLCFGCGSVSKVVVSNDALDRLMEQEAFKIEVEAVEPQVTAALAQLRSNGLMRAGDNISSIFVSGEGYFIKMDGQNISANLPYYGERQMGGGYGSDAGIKFNTTALDLEITKNQEKQTYQITFSVNNSSESYFFTIDIGNSLNSTVRVRSSHRNRIRFTGTVKELEKEDYVSN